MQNSGFIGNTVKGFGTIVILAMGLSLIMLFGLHLLNLLDPGEVAKEITNYGILGAIPAGFIFGLLLLFKK